MSQSKWADTPLTDGQRLLVRKNIGLVAVHLRRRIGRVSAPSKNREWEDLFQEGCLGLIQAALSYREERGIPFAAYALPRIHNRVSRALHTKFATMRIPIPRRSSRRHTRETICAPAPSKTRSVSEELRRCIPDTRRREHGCPGSETVGDRLRGKIERAVLAAADRLSGTPSTRGDRDQLVRVLVEERLLVPQEDSRRPIRQIARETCSSFARVAQCEKQLSECVRSALESDPEFVELRRHAAADADGAAVPIDGELERRLGTACADEFMQRMRTSTAETRARILTVLLSLVDGDLDEALHGRVARLPAMAREALLRNA